MGHDVFISYSSKDKHIGNAACNVLERNGVRCWMAPRDILPGDGWAKSIVGAIGRSRAMVLVFSGNANASPQIEREVERAINKGIPLIPFRIEDVTPSDALEYFLSAPHWLDAFTPPLEQHLDRLAEAVRALLQSRYVGSGPEKPLERPDDPPLEVREERHPPPESYEGLERAAAPPVEDIDVRPADESAIAGGKAIFAGVAGLERNLMVIAALAGVSSVVILVSITAISFGYIIGF